MHQNVVSLLKELGAPDPRSIRLSRFQDTGSCPPEQTQEQMRLPLAYLAEYADKQTAINTETYTALVASGARPAPRR
jgi:hypothetical protein